MTEQQWRECGDPDTLLGVLGEGACPRRLRLFSAACCRRVWHLLDEPAFREAVEAAEAFADGLASEGELDAAWEATFGHRAGDGLSDDPLANARFWAADAATHSACDLNRACAVASSAAWAASWASERTADAALDRERAAQCDLLRCLFGNPHRPPPAAEGDWTRWSCGAARELALAIVQGATAAGCDL